jgi:hypothetical protein
MLFTEYGGWPEQSQRANKYPYNNMYTALGVMLNTVGGARRPDIHGMLILACYWMYLLARRRAVLASKTVKPPTVGREGAVTIAQPGGASQCAELFVTQRRPGRLGVGYLCVAHCSAGGPKLMFVSDGCGPCGSINMQPSNNNQQPTTNVPCAGSNPAISDLRSFTHMRAGDEPTSHFSTQPLV